jgi:hypothetical protein
VSVAGETKKGKSVMKQHPRRPLRQWLGILMVFEIQHQHYQETHNHQHQNAEGMA